MEFLLLRIIEVITLILGIDFIGVFVPSVFLTKASIWPPMAFYVSAGIALVAACIIGIISLIMLIVNWY